MTKQQESIKIQGIMERANSSDGLEPDRLTLKGLFERLIRVESKIDMAKDTDDKVSQRFTYFVFVIIVLEVANLVVHYFL